MTNETTASQPKSIGDDARLEQLFQTYYKSQTVDEMTTLKAAIIGHIVRAPAAQASSEQFRVIAAEASAKVLVLKRQLRDAQASATIQAAPDSNTELQETSNKLLDYLGQILDAKEVMRALGIPYADFKTMFAQFASARVQHDSDCSLHNMPAYPAGPCDCSATIQEPVMVAESEGKPSREAAIRKVLAMQGEMPNCVGPTVCTIPPPGWNCTRAPGHGGPCAAWPDGAAPMVADPAGVALTYPCWSCKKPYTLDQRSYADGRCPHCDVDIDLEMDDEADAATVKAVPSEACRQYYYKVDGCKADKPSDASCICWHDEGTGPMGNRPYEVRSWRFAAPLADKTGGGE